MNRAHKSLLLAFILAIFSAVTTITFAQATTPVPTVENTTSPNVVVPTQVEATPTPAATTPSEPTPTPGATETPKPAQTTNTDKPKETSESQPNSETTNTDKPQETTESKPTSETTNTDKPKETTESQPNSETTNTDKPKETTEAKPTSETTNTDKPNSEANNQDKPKEAAEPAPSPEEVARQQKLIEADKLFLSGQVAAAQKIYQEVKAPFAQAITTAEIRPAPILDATQLPPAGKVYWREAEAGLIQKLETRTMVPLRLLVEQYPQFLPGHLKYAQALKLYSSSDNSEERTKEALQVLERAATLYPDQPDLIKAKVTALADAKKWMEASLAARQFAILYASNPAAPEFAKLAEDNLKRYKSHVRGEVRGNAIANLITGVVGYAVTGSLFGPLTAVDSTVMLLRGEEAVGASVAKQAKRYLDFIKDEPTLAYVDEVGQKMVKVSGRDEFKYEFSVVADDTLNAFALPGGKIFINAGAIEKTQSEAELAGLLAHEISHVVLSHGFQLVTQGNLLANLTQYIPFGGTVANLFTLSYSRDMERQADTLGTRMLASTNYAADGLHNLMVTLYNEKKSSPPEWLASHPGPADRVQYLERLIVQNRYNRYAYEGVARHADIKAKVKEIMAQKKKEREEKKRR